MQERIAESLSFTWNNRLNISPFDNWSITLHINNVTKERMIKPGAAVPNNSNTAIKPSFWRSSLIWRFTSNLTVYVGRKLGSSSFIMVVCYNIGSWTLAGFFSVCTNIGTGRGCCVGDVVTYAERKYTSCSLKTFLLTENWVLRHMTFKPNSTNCSSVLVSYRKRCHS